MARPVHRPGNLPAEATSFVGRRRELAEARRRLTEARLVSLTGPGGVGKTRLALRLAAELRRGYPDGVWLVELADLRDPVLLADAVLAALDLRDQAGAEPRGRLREHLRSRKLLLVLDNCEHLLAPVSELVTEILKTAIDVRVLATTREPLSVRGEHVLVVPPLAEDAVTLFAARAAASSGSFVVDDANRAAVAGLCRRLDGLPLAIELAAVRTRLLSPQQILDRLTDRFALLTAAGHAVPPRHRTLRTTVDWSHDLLDDAERTLLRRLCVFAGRFTLDDVEGVCADGGPVLDVLASLVDKSLVMRADVRGVACYRLHETMREYAAERLAAAGETVALEDRQTAYYHSWGRRAAGESRYRLVEWLAWMDLEIDNIRPVLRRCADRGDPAVGLELVACTGWYWITRATGEGGRWLDEFRTRVPPTAIAGFLRGFLAVLRSDPAASVPELDVAVDLAAAAGDMSLAAQALAMGSMARHMAGDLGGARERLDQARRRAEDYPAVICVLQAQALNGLAGGDADAVRAAAAEGVRLSRAAGDLYSLGMMLLNLAAVADDKGPLLAEALRSAERIDDRIAQYCLLDLVAGEAAGAARYPLAARLLGAAETVRAEAGAGLQPFLVPLIDRAERATLNALGPARYRSAREAGRRMGRADAVALALGEPDPPAEAPEPSPLRKREAEVAELVAQGLSNRQIGARLFISEHTVDTHVRGILTRLGFTSRTQIAAWLAARR